MNVGKQEPPKLPAVQFTKTIEEIKRQKSNFEQRDKPNESKKYIDILQKLIHRKKARFAVPIEKEYRPDTSIKPSSPY